MGQIDHEIWRAILPELIYGYDSAIPTKWREERDKGNYLGPPITPEIDVQPPDGADSAKEQGFSSGATIHWDPINGAYLC